MSCVLSEMNVNSAREDNHPTGLFKNSLDVFSSEVNCVLHMLLPGHLFILLQCKTDCLSSQRSHSPPPFTNDFYTFWWCTRSTMMWGTQKNEPIIETGQLCLLLVAHKLLMLEKFGLKLKRKAKNGTTAVETINRCQDFNAKALNLYLNTHFVIHWAWAPITCLLLHIVGWMHLFKNTL